MQIIVERKAQIGLAAAEIGNGKRLAGTGNRIPYKRFDPCDKFEEFINLPELMVFLL